MTEKVEALAVDGACKTVFKPISGSTEGTADSSGFPAEVTSFLRPRYPTRGFKHCTHHFSLSHLLSGIVHS